MMKFAVPGLVAALSALAGCQTTEQHQADVNASLDARLSAYHGSTIAVFTARTGMLPIDAYEVSGGRVFVFRTDPVYVTLPATHVTPAVTRSAQCQLLIRAEPNGVDGTADSWRIVGTQRSGGCNNLPV